MDITKDKVVSIDYTLKDEKGTVLDTSIGGQALYFIQGSGQLISGLENELDGKKLGDKFQVEIAPEFAYGFYNEEMVHIVSLDNFQGEEELQLGMQVQVQTPNGNNIAEVTKIEGNDVTLDLNHPLADKTLHFDVEVKEVRDATAEELSHGHVHGPGGHHH